MTYNRFLTLALVLIGIPSIALADGNCDPIKTQASEAIAQYGVIKAVLNGNVAVAEEFHLNGLAPSELHSMMDVEVSKITELKVQATNIASQLNEDQRGACLEIFEGCTEFPG